MSEFNDRYRLMANVGSIWKVRYRLCPNAQGM